MDTYAIIAEREITALCCHPNDESARDWHRSVAAPGATLAVLDLAADAAPRVGDIVIVDENGIAKLAYGGWPQTAPRWEDCTAADLARGEWTGLDWATHDGVAEQLIDVDLDDEEAVREAGWDAALDLARALREAREDGATAEDDQNLLDQAEEILEAAWDLQRDCRSDAAAALQAGEAAAHAAREGRWKDAVAAAHEAARIEAEYGDSPTWGSAVARLVDRLADELGLSNPTYDEGVADLLARAAQGGGR